MKLWLILLQDHHDGYTWLEGAWGDEMTAANPDGWKAEVERCRQIAGDDHEMRICSITIPGLLGVFDIPDLEGEIDRKDNQ